MSAYVVMRRVRVLSHARLACNRTLACKTRRLAGSRSRPPLRGLKIKSRHHAAPSPLACRALSVFVEIGVVFVCAGSSVGAHQVSDFPPNITSSWIARAMCTCRPSWRETPSTPTTSSTTVSSEAVETGQRYTGGRTQHRAGRTRHHAGRKRQSL